MIYNKGDDLPLNDHVIRYIKPRYVNAGVMDANGFLCRPGEKASSVNWLECENIELIRKNSPLKYHKMGILAEVNVGFTKNYMKEQADLSLSFIYDPSSHNHSHSLIHGLPVISAHESELLSDLLNYCIVKLHPAV
jgi:hypothetical protein